MRVLIWATLAVFSFNASAATFNVSTAIELRAALSEAAANGEDDTIVVSDGIIKTTDDGQGTFVYLSKEANTLIIEGSSSDKAILSGGGVDQILQHTSTEDAVLELRNLSFIDGYTSDVGGAVRSSYGANVYNCKFQNNTAENYGGAIYNRASSVSGGASDVFVMIIEDSVFDNNSALDGAGFYTRTATVIDSTFTNNKAGQNGGGFYVWTNEGGSKNTVSGSLLENNSAGNEGGGFYSRATDAEIHKSTFRSNSASSGGGFYSSSVSVYDSRIIDNLSSETGAGFSTSGGSNGASVVNSFIIGNVNTKEGVAFRHCGGGFYARTLNLVNSVVIRNVSAEGGAFCASYNVRINNSLLAKNSSGISIDSGGNYIINSIFFGNGSEDVAETPAKNSAGSSPTFTISHSYIDTSKVAVPFFPPDNILFDVALGFEDEAKENYRLTESSVLIDAGTVNIEGLTILDVDLDDNARVLGGDIDIGPFEYSDSRTTILSFGVSGGLRVGSVITLSFEIDPADVEAGVTTLFDFGDGEEQIAEGGEYVFDVPGSYTVRLIVVNEEGARSSRTLSFDIRDLTLEEKLVAAEQVGKDSVINNPALYGLLTSTDLEAQLGELKGTLTAELESAVQATYEAVKNDPTAYGVDIGFDIDGDGESKALTDGLLLIRYLFGFTGDSLVSGAISEGAERETAEEVEAYLEQRMP